MVKRSSSQPLLKIRRKLLRIKSLISHEKLSDGKLKKMMRRMKKDGFQRRDIVAVSVKTKKGTRHVIADGHHRTEALRRLGYDLVSAAVIDEEDYKNPKIVKISSWNDSNRSIYNPSNIIEMALSGRRLKPHITKHMVSIEGNGIWDTFHKNEVLEPENATSLELLRR